MKRPNEAIDAIVRSLKVDGDYYACGEHRGAPPRLSVEGLGQMAYPLLEMQAEPLRQLADPAPYGRGAQTLVDEEVRRSRQLAPAQLSIGEGWQGQLSQITASACEGLGVKGEVEARLYKMLVYGPGDFFAPHRDTEKEGGMCALMAVRRSR